MDTALPYVRPAFVEHQRLVTRLSGLGTLAFLALVCSMPALYMFWVVITSPLRTDGMLVIPFLLAIPLAGFLARITTVVESGDLRLIFTIGPLRILRRIYPLSTVLACELVQPGGPMSARPGWHLMNVPGVALFKISGGDLYVMVRPRQPAVVISLGHFKGLALGSTRPQELADSINAAISPIPATAH